MAGPLSMEPSILGFVTAWWSQDSKSANLSVHVPTKFLLVSCLVISYWSNQVTPAESLYEEELYRRVDTRKSLLWRSLV